jgi:hypothetical protein
VKQGQLFPVLTPPPRPPTSVVPGLYILDEFLEVVNVSKRLPEVNHDVVHHIVTTGPPIETKFHRLDGEKLEAAQAEFKICKRTAFYRGQLHLRPVCCSWCKKLTAAGSCVEISAG